MVNLERFHAIAIALKHELHDANVPGLVRQLADGLRQMVQDPAQPGYQQTVSNLRRQLDEALETVPSDTYSPAWRQSVDELGVSDVFGANLRAQINEIFGRNEITPSAAADEIEQLAGRLDQLSSELDRLLGGLEYLDIGAEELEAGQFEIGFLIPRGEVNEELVELGEEFKQLSRLLGPLLEVATGSRPQLEVRSISSSSFQVFLASGSAVALAMAKTLESLITSYEKLLGIRQAHEALKESDVPDEALSGVENYAQEFMQGEIEQIAADLIADADGDESRKNELKIELTMSLNGLANRLDRGFGIEVRAGEIPDADDEDEPTGDEDERTAAELIRSKQAKLRFMNVSGKPILGLPEGDGPEAKTADP